MFTFKPASKNTSNGDGQKTEIGKGNGWLGLVNSHPKSGNGNGAHNRVRGNGHANKIESVLGPGINYQGTLTGVGGIRIEGAFDGAISIKGALVVADGAKVTADIQAASVTVGGSVKGNITAEKVEILATGRVWGDLITTAFATEEGAFLRGQVRMEDQVPDAEEAPAPEPIMVVTSPATVSAHAAALTPDAHPETQRPKNPSLKPSTGWSR